MMWQSITINEFIMNKKELSTFQKESIAKRKAELDAAQAELDEYYLSEQYQRDMWEAAQDRWEKKAKKEGWHYERKPFISAADRKRIAEQTKEQEIAFLEEKLKSLKGEND